MTQASPDVTGAPPARPCVERPGRGDDSHLVTGSPTPDAASPAVITDPEEHADVGKN